MSKEKKVKLLIEIDEGNYEHIKNGCFDYWSAEALYNAIANGIPYNPTGDLISREALKRAACVKFYTSPYYKHILDLIDNAPTVPQGEFNLDELCRLRSDLKTGAVVGSTLRYQYQIDRYIKAIDDVIGADMRKDGAE